MSLLDLRPLDSRPFAGGRRVLLLALAALYLFSLAGDAELRTPAAGAAAVAANLALAAALGLALWRPETRAPLALVAASAVAIAWLAPHGAGIAPTYLAVAVIGARLPLRPGAPAAVAVAVFSAAALPVRTAAHDATGFGLELAGLALTYLAVLSARRTQQQQEIARQAQLGAAAEAERSRVAREVHDVLAHSLTALTVQLELARAQLRKNPADPTALATVERAHTLARQGLEEARRAVGALRGEPAAGPERLPALAADFEADTGVACSVELADGLGQLSSEARVAIYRTAQEALTNVRRHARPARVAVAVRRAAGGVELTVENDGEARPSAAGGGFGLTGLRERAELLGGRLEAGPDAGGFRVRLWLPA